MQRQQWNGKFQFAKKSIFFAYSSFSSTFHEKSYSQPGSEVGKSANFSRHTGFPPWKKPWLLLVELIVLRKLHYPEKIRLQFDESDAITYTQVVHDTDVHPCCIYTQTEVQTERTELKQTGTTFSFVL